MMTVRLGLRCFVMMLAVLLADTLRAESAPAAPPPEKPAPEAPQGAVPPRGRPGGRFRYGPGMWQAFSQLSAEERAALQKLQREDPVKFREVMDAKAEELYKKLQARIAELEALAKACREAKDPQEAQRLREKLTAEVEKDFREHLAANRRHLEEMKRRAQRMESELDLREKKCAEAVQARVEAMIRGEKPPLPPHDHRGKFGKKPLEK